MALVRTLVRALLGGLLCVLGPLGCEVDSGPAMAVTQPSRATFVHEAGPILAARCGDYACHGNANRPFALYAVARRRLRAADNFTSHPLTEAELDANFAATTGFLDHDRPRDTTLVQKALGIGGKGGHKGGGVFAAPSDPECRALIRWISGEQQ
ncbi:MAG: hypothetical protein KC502_13545 [Myxococcales bacterium]|nr:hypothetical protein [Myxococcales bacterium]